MSTNYSVETNINTDTQSTFTQATNTTEPRKPVLQIGSRGVGVVELQKLLAHWEYYYGSFDGVFGADVETAVKGYQHRVFLKEDGIVGSLTWKALYAGTPVNMPILRSGSTGSDVQLVQTILQFSGRYPYVIDGIFSPEMQVVVRTFQRDSGLPADGIIGDRTWNALSKMPH
ncbi:MAG TPA: peptidoglycan-binding protein [Cyanobacteria bacterium UBA8553]|nr:peptidoglycan-binding protein [Cyanobacteria bacterium UBA8553]HAJ58887.1 peptidoglycan-binding protein [Cyanobacteria bacterium UBA8543]